MNDSPNPAAAAMSMLRARRVSIPEPRGDAVAAHDSLGPILDALRTSGIASLPAHQDALRDYRDQLSGYSPDQMSPTEALAFWLNLYNAGSLDAASTAFNEDVGSVLRIPGAFSSTWTTIDDEALSLNDIEHGKIRRFGDPRIHSALVCGSASCPTLRYEPFVGSELDTQLDDQMRAFLRSGGATVDRQGDTIRLSRIFLWYGRDFTNPHTMPNLAPAKPERLRDTVAWWLGEDDREFVWETAPAVEFQAYDWALACSIA